MFRAIGRYFRALGYLLVGRIDDARKTVMMSPHAVRATYDDVIREKVTRIRQYRTAVAGLITNVENKKVTLKGVSSEVAKHEGLKAGALAMAKKRAVVLKSGGKTEQEIKSDADYMKYRAAFGDFDSTLKEKQARIAELEQDVTAGEQSIANHRVQMQSLLRDLDKIRSEQEEAVADIITAREEKEIADMLTGLSADGSARELADLRDLRQRAKAEARVAKEMAGTDTRAMEAQFLEAARADAAGDEFDQLTGISESVAPAPAETETASREPLPS